MTRVLRGSDVSEGSIGGGLRCSILFGLRLSIADAVKRVWM